MDKKILVIDDEELVAESLKKFLKREGYDVNIAKSGIEAMERIKKTDFNLIVSDIRMPDMNGIEIIKEIREYLRQNEKQSIPEIFITGYASKENLKEAEELNVVDYIYKPFNIKEFLVIINRNLKS